MKVTFGPIDGYPEMHVLDSTDPAQIKSFEEKVNLAKTLFIVSSKSGGTLEPNIFKQYFFERVKDVVGVENVGNQFIAITDPNSHLQEVAEGDKFSRIYFGDPTIGGRFSALSNFGMIPAAASGIDVSKILDQTEQMVHACAGCVPTEDNPGVVLGTVLGVLGNEGINKITIAASPQIYNFGAWLEQLLAESTGKEGKGLTPVAREELGSPEVYGQDRLFVYIRYQPEPNAKQDEAIDQLEKAGHPVMRIDIDDIYDIGQEFFRWEMATAVAGSIMKIHPFNQPDVEESKIVTKVKGTFEFTTASMDTLLSWVLVYSNLGNIHSMVGSDVFMAGSVKLMARSFVRSDTICAIEVVAVTHNTEINSLFMALSLDYDTFLHWCNSLIFKGQSV